MDDREEYALAIWLAIFAGLLLLAWPAESKADEIYRPLSSYTVSSTITGSVAASDNVSGQTRAVRLVCSTECRVAFAASTAASLSGTAVFLPADMPEIFKITPGQWILVGAETGGSAGTLYITEMGQ